MARAFHAELLGMIVENGQLIHEDDEDDLDQFRENIALVEKLGGEVITVYGDNVATSIHEYARVSGITKIVIGRSMNKGSRLMKTTIVDQLIQLGPDIDLYIIPDQADQPSKRRKATFEPFNLQDTSITLLILILCTLISWLFESLHYTLDNIITVYIFGVLLNAMITKGRLMSAFSAVSSVLLFNFLFVEPKYSFTVHQRGYPITLLIMFVAAMATSTLTKRLKEQGSAAIKKTYRTEILLETSQKLQQAKSETEILKGMTRQIQKLLDRPVCLFVANNQTLEKPLVISQDMNFEALSVDDTEMGVATWVYQNGKRAGNGTSTLSASRYLYLAVRGKAVVYAVVGIEMIGQRPLDVLEKNVLMAIISEGEIAMENEVTARKNHDIALQMQQEQTRSNLLRSISHDLRTPLTAISGNAMMLIDQAPKLSDPEKLRIYQQIDEDSGWLMGLVENLLAITRLDEPQLNLNFQPEVLDEIIVEALKHVSREVSQHQMVTDFNDKVFIVEVESRLMVQLFVNLMNNAIKYTPEGSTILIAIHQQGSDVLIEVIDNGPGLSDMAKDHVFDLFYTEAGTSSDSRRGMGIGLALCKSIVEIHGGTIGVRDHQPHGSDFFVTLPIKEVFEFEDHDNPGD